MFIGNLLRVRGFCSLFVSGCLFPFVCFASFFLDFLSFSVSSCRFSVPVVPFRRERS